MMNRVIYAAVLVLPIVAGCGKGASTASSATGSVASALGGQKFTFDRTYKVGDKDSYNVKVEQSTGKVDISMTMTQEITKVYDNGDADMKDTSSDMVMNMGGKVSNVPPQQPVTMRVDKYGSPQGSDNGNPGGGYAAALSQIKGGISVGQTVPYDYTNPATPGSHDVGKITYVSGGATSKFHVVSDNTDAKGAKTHMEGDFSVDSATKKPVSVDLTITTTGEHASTSHMVMTQKNP